MVSNAVPDKLADSEASIEFLNYTYHMATRTWRLLYPALATFAVAKRLPFAVPNVCCCLSGWPLIDVVSSNILPLHSVAVA